MFVHQPRPRTGGQEAARPAAQRTGVRRAARSAAVATAVLAASMSVALSAGSASAAASPAAGVTWHKLSLVNGWTSAENFLTGGPAWAVKNGIVYLSGSIRQPSGSNSEFGVLPRAARPAHALYITVYTLDETSGHVDIFPNGELAATSAVAGNAQGFTSLAAISFPAASTARHKLTLINGWKSSQGAWNTGDPSYTLRGGVVYLSGALHQPGGFSSGEFAILPKAARPARLEFVTVYTLADTTGNLLIYPNGIIAANGGDITGFTSLAGVSYPQAAVTRHKLTLVNGWASAQHQQSTGDPSYSIRGGVVYLSGSLVQPVAGSGPFATLPRAIRPAHYLYIQVYALNTTLATLQIDPNGTAWVYSVTASDARDFTSLAAVSYPLKS